MQSTTGGGVEHSRNRTYSPLSSRAKRGDPVNKKVLRANARRHIALDCHSRTPTFSTLIVLLRNDRDICPAHMRGQHLHSKLYTLNSIIVTHGVTIISLCAQRCARGAENDLLLLIHAYTIKHITNQREFLLCGPQLQSLP